MNKLVKVKGKMLEWLIGRFAMSLWKHTRVQIPLFTKMLNIKYHIKHKIN